MYRWRKVRSIPTWYKGVKFRSKLEASWAEFFTIHRMQWAYEPEGFDFDGVLYLPDFWLPEIKTFVEVKGILQEKDEEKIFALAMAAGFEEITVILAGSPVGQNYRIVYDSLTLSDEVVLGLCARCNRWFFVNIGAAWRCPACGYSYGDATFKMLHPGKDDFASERCPDCAKGKTIEINLGKGLKW